MRLRTLFPSFSLTSTILFILCICFLLVPNRAHANVFKDFYNGMQQFSELPTEVNKLKESYEESLHSLNEAKEQLQAYEQHNAQLLEQNRQLSETVQLLHEQEQSRQNRAHQIKSVIIWAIALTLGYFIFTRTIRFLMKRSN